MPLKGFNFKSDAFDKGGPFAVSECMHLIPTTQVFSCLTEDLFQNYWQLMLFGNGHHHQSIFVHKACNVDLHGWWLDYKRWWGKPSGIGFQSHKIWLTCMDFLESDHSSMIFPMKFVYLERWKINTADLGVNKENFKLYECRKQVASVA